MERKYYDKITEFAQEFLREYVKSLSKPDGKGLPENDKLIISKINALYAEIDEICPGKGYAYLIAELSTRFYRKEYQ